MQHKLLCTDVLKARGRVVVRPISSDRVVACAATNRDCSPFAQEALRFLGALAASTVILSNSAPALAVLNSPNAQIARSVDSALRRSIPAFNAEVKAIQDRLEDVQYLLRIPQRKPWGSIAASVAEALSSATQRPDAMLAGVPPASRPAGDAALGELVVALRKVDLAVRTQQPEAVALRVAEGLRSVAELELLQAPGLPFLLPKEYQSLPRLEGRAVVELVLEKADGSLGFVDPAGGGPARSARLLLTVDGYSAPISAGEFVRNVMDGLYDDRPVQVNYTSVFVQGPPTLERPPVPLEILPAGEFEPLYRLPLDVQSGELPVLPLSITGALTFARLPGSSEAFLSGTDWFVYKFDRTQAGLAGLAFDEGTFGVFGYVTEGVDTLSRIGAGDVIKAARVVSGADRLVLP